MQSAGGMAPDALRMVTLWKSVAAEGGRSTDNEMDPSVEPEDPVNATMFSFNGAVDGKGVGVGVVEMFESIVEVGSGAIFGVTMREGRVGEVCFFKEGFSAVSVFPFGG